MSIFGIGLISSDCKSMSDAILKFKMVAFDFLQHWEKQANIPVDECFRNRDDIQKPEIYVLRHFEIEDCNFQFMKNWEKQSNTPAYGYFWNRDDIQRLQIDVRRHFEIQDVGLKFM